MTAFALERMIDEQDEELFEVQNKARIRAVQDPELYHVAYWEDLRKTPDQLFLEIQQMELR